MLVRTPCHNPTESLLGYVLRLSETNGYDTPWHVLSHAGIDQGEMRTAGFPVEKLAAVLGRLPSSLSGISYNGIDESGDREFRLLGHRLGKGLSHAPLKLTRPAICPHCIAECGYIDAFFDLNLAVACPIHRCKVTDHCNACNQPLSCFRPGMLTCRCGASLSENQVELSSPELVDLMAVIWSLLHRTPHTAFPNETGLPVSQLLGTPLRSLIVKLPDLGNSQLRSTDAEIDHAKPLEELLHGAASVLSNWPQGFYDFLGRLALTDKTHESATFGKRFEHFSRSFFSTHRHGGDLVWLRDEFLRYGLHRWDESAIDKKMLRGEAGEARYISKSELARRLNVTETTLLAWLQQGRVSLKTIRTNNQTRYVADLNNESIQIPVAAEGSVFQKREAARYLGLPVSVLDRLKANGSLTVRHRAKQKNGFHQADLDSFLKLLVALAPRRSEDDDGILTTATVDLAKILREYRFHDSDRKAEFVATYMSGKVSAAYRTGERLEDIFFLKSDIDVIASNSRSLSARRSLSLKETAKLIGCDAKAVPGLLKSGFLIGEDGREGLRVGHSSITTFIEQYEAVGSLARKLETSSKRLLRICAQASIPVLQVTANTTSPISFVARDAVVTLQRLSHENPVKKPENEVQNRALVAVGSYLAELERTGAVLPRRGDRPHRRNIASACGVDRGVFYRNEAVIQLVEDYATKESSRHKRCESDSSL